MMLRMRGRMRGSHLDAWQGEIHVSEIPHNEIL